MTGWWFLLALLPILVIAGVGLLVILYIFAGTLGLDSLLQLGDPPAPLTCWHCGRETAPGRTCRHCGSELQ
ncbi:MAG: hypothetical protein ACF8TS_06320 [Maioricimonas sp. JB049]